MDEMMILEATERYYAGEMTAAEQAWFDQLRRDNAEVDQMVVAHHLFLQQMGRYNQHRTDKHTLHSLHAELLESGAISEKDPSSTQATIIKFWSKYKRTIAVAASIAGITAVSVTLLGTLFSPDNRQENTLQQLSKKVSALEAGQNVQARKINEIITPKANGAQISGGTGFLIDGDGYLVTNLHVVAGASNLVVASEGSEFIAKRVYTDAENDLAILRIEDEDWKPVTSLPYRFRKSGIELGEEIFTLGFPRNDIVYNRGYMSSRSGYDNDTLSIQIAISANPGNSGGPVFDANGEIIGILSTRDKKANDVVFATKSIQIAKAVENLKNSDTTYQDVRLPSGKSLTGVNRVAQIKKMKSCIFIVKGY